MDFNTVDLHIRWFANGVLNVPGHRISTAEVESALVGDRAEAAVVGVPHPMKGQGIYAFVTLKQGETPGETLKARLVEAVRRDIGRLAAPRLESVGSVAARIASSARAWWTPRPGGRNEDGDACRDLLLASRDDPRTGAAARASVRSVGRGRERVGEVRHGSDLGFRRGNGDYALVATFPNRANWEAYQAHPKHKALVQNVVTPIQASRLTIQS